MKMVTIREAQTNLSRLIEKSLSRRRDHDHARAPTQSRVWFRIANRKSHRKLAPEELDGWDSIG
jgi:hypothetical protein